MMMDSGIEMQTIFGDGSVQQQNSGLMGKLLSAGNRLLTGEIEDPTVPGVLDYMGMTPNRNMEHMIMGDDATGYVWAKDYVDEKVA